MLYYLDDSFGKQFKKLGIIFIVTGFLIALSISFTIILIVIFNSTIDTREKNLNNPPQIYNSNDNQQNLPIIDKPNESNNIKQNTQNDVKQNTQNVILQDIPNYTPTPNLSQKI